MNPDPNPTDEQLAGLAAARRGERLTGRRRAVLLELAHALGVPPSRDAKALGDAIAAKLRGETWAS